MIWFFAFLIFLPMFVHMSYVYVMGMKKARDKGNLEWPVYLFAVPTIVIMLPFYWFLNISLASLLFLELPKSLAFTARCQRHLEENSWRGRQARWWCRVFLNPFDEGHC